MAKSQGLSGALTNYTPVLARTATMLDENFGEAHLSVRAQSRCHSHSTASQLIGVTPAYSMRWTAMSCASMDTPPEASVTARTHSHRLAPEYRHFPTDLGPERGNAQLFPSCLLHRLDDALVLPSVDEAAIERL